MDFWAHLLFLSRLGRGQSAKRYNTRYRNTVTVYDNKMRRWLPLMEALKRRGRGSKILLQKRGVEQRKFMHSTLTIKVTRE